ncbi:nuclear transport factor 2 family protein [Nocardia mexicana]|uniref:nuclear transport factor 2 family protein n=1 Tax=Nocardia mexicana TaxID=279262 RepID=UPI001B85DC54|nr:nuclear transport factor 2 family protein [Nocardia mexicana]
MPSPAARSNPGDKQAPDDLEPAAAVAAVHAIKQLKARYFRAIDGKDWAMLRQQLTTDVEVDTSASFGPITTGADEFIDFLRLTIGPARTVHHGHMPEIEISSPTAATGVWALQDLLIFPGDIRVIGFGHYHERYALVGDRWLISSSKLTRIYLDPLGERQLFGV